MRIADDRRLVAYRHDSPVAGEQPVLGAQRVAPLARGRDLSEHAFPVVGVEQALEQLGLGELLRGIAQHRVDLRAHEERPGALADGVDVRDEGELGGERAVLRLGLAEPFPDTGGLADVLGDEQRPGGPAVRARERRQREGGDELFAVLPSMTGLDALDPLAAAHQLDEIRRLAALAVLAGKQ